MTAAQKWNFTTAAAEKDLFTFAGEEGDLTPMTGTKVPRRIVMTATTNVYNFNQVPPATVHRFHGAPNASPTGRGNHPTRTINSLFGGIDYPCNTIPAAVAGMPGYYWYPVGQGFYHAADVVAWSNWTYGSAHKRPLSNPPPVSEQYNQQTDGYPPTKGPWAACCAGRRASYGWIRGGWVRRMIRENLFGAYRDLRLYSYRVDSGAGSPTQVRGVANVLARVTGTMDMNGECCDGCIARVDGAAMPGVPSPHLSCVYSAIVDRTYLYRRDQGSSDFTLDGVTGADKLVGSGADTTCKFLGISSRSETGNYVYLLGLNQINQWLRDVNAPSGMLLNELTDVAVSDQWWQTGGIVYAYDASKGSVYRFVRNEEGENGLPNEIDVRSDGVLPDKIGADGFGSLYLMRTEFEPSNTSSFIPGAESSYALDSVMAGGINRYRARFKQKVYKSVYVRDYYTGAITRMPGRVLLGTNTFYRDFVALDPSDYSTWSWVSGYGQFAPIVDANVRTELGVINSPTPPRPSNLDARADNWGPLALGGSGFVNSTPLELDNTDGHPIYGDDTDLWFMVENAPMADANEVNTGNFGLDANGNGSVGQFPTTVQFSSLKFYWKIVQTHNRFDEPESATILDMEADGNSGDYLLLFPPTAGRFRVGVKVAYRYYDYTRLPVGALSNRKGDVITPSLDLPPLTARAITKDGGTSSDGYSWREIHVKTIPPIISPEDRGVIMSGICNGASPDDGMISNFKPGPRLLGFGCNNAGWNNENCRHPHCSSSNDALTPTKFVIDGISLVPQPPEFDASTNSWQTVYSPDAVGWNLQLRDSNYNLARGVNRIASMTSEEPPRPNDPDLILESLVWAGGFSVTWTSELKRGDDTVVSKQIVTPSPILSLEQLRKLFPVPSEPASYSLSVNCKRSYRYEVWHEIPRYDENGDVIEGESISVRIPRAVHMNIWSDAEILVTDNTPPATHLTHPDSEGAVVVEAYFAQTPILYGTTGETLWETQSPPVANPSTLVFVVADNNPMANQNFNNGGRDPYHYGVAGVGSRLKVNFKINNQLATFSYQTRFGPMPPVLADGEVPTAEQQTLRRYYTSGSGSAYKVTSAPVTSETQFNTLTGTTGKYCKSFSYRVYSIALRDIKHFSKDFIETAGSWDYTGNWNARMHPDHANNSSGYRSLLYGLGWSEACNVAATNDLSIEPQQVSQLIVRDNDRPNVFIRARQDKYPDSLFFAPSNVKTNTLPSRWVQYATPGMGDAVNNGPLSWEADDSSAAFDGDFKITPTAPVTSLLFPDGEKLEVDVPARFDLLVADNAGDVATVSFELRDAGDNVLVNGMFGANLPLQYVFREPGYYKITAEIADNAVSWPTNPQVYLPAAAGDPGVVPAKNRRKIQAVFEVVPTRLDFRVIERQRTPR